MIDIYIHVTRTDIHGNTLFMPHPAAISALCRKISGILVPVSLRYHHVCLTSISIECYLTEVISNVRNYKAGLEERAWERGWFNPYSVDGPVCRRTILICIYYTRKNAQVCYKSVHKLLLTRCICTACHKLSTGLEQLVDNL